jgi:tetratricopeptide (TPR) repeat protein
VKRTIALLDYTWITPGPWKDVAVPPLRAENPEQEKTLVSWKEIASFLDRAERTVRRWEHERGLPVHRVPGGERGGVFAYPSELADWLRGKSSELEADDQATGARETGGTDETAPSGSEMVHPLAAETSSGSNWMGRVRLVRFAVIGMAVLAGAAVFANFAHSFGKWIQQRVPGVAGSTPQFAPQVSDVEIRVAHDLYLKGRFEWNQRTPDNLDRALDDFTQAIVHNPYDAHAYAGLADTYEMLFIYGSRQDDDARDRAMVAARKAVELDESLSEAHRALGYAVWRSGDIGEAEKELHLAIQLDPKDSLAHLWLSNVLASQSKEGECLAEINRAQELDPASASILAVKGDRLYWMGMKEEGLALLKAAENSEPRLGIAHWYLAAIAFERRDYRTYLRESELTAESRNDAWLRDTTTRLAAAYARGGERGLLNAEFAVQESCSPPAYEVFGVNRTQKALDCALVNRIPEALHLLDEASANHDKEFDKLRNSFAADVGREPQGSVSKLASNPHFQALMQQKNRLQRRAKLPVSSASAIF